MVDDYKLKYNRLFQQFKELNAKHELTKLELKDTYNRIDKSSENSYNELKLEKEHLEELLQRYKELRNDGYVYDKERTDTLLTFRELFILVLVDQGYSKKYISELLDFRLKETSNGDQIREFKQKLRCSHYLILSKKVGFVFKEQTKECSFRFKGILSVSDVIGGGSGFRNQYPIDYKQVISDYLVINPVEEWHLLPPTIELNDNKLFCKKCNQIFDIKDLNTHKKLKKHNK